MCDTMECVVTQGCFFHFCYYITFKKQIRKNQLQTDFMLFRIGAIFNSGYWLYLYCTQAKKAFTTCMLQPS